jgi:hypothetical protein
MHQTPQRNTGKTGFGVLAAGKTISMVPSDLFGELNQGDHYEKLI